MNRRGKSLKKNKKYIFKKAISYITLGLIFFSLFLGATVSFPKEVLAAEPLEHKFQFSSDYKKIITTELNGSKGRYEYTLLEKGGEPACYGGLLGPTGEPVVLGAGEDCWFVYKSSPWMTWDDGGLFILFTFDPTKVKGRQAYQGELAYNSIVGLLRKSFGDIIVYGHGTSADAKVSGSVLMKDEGGTEQQVNEKVNVKITSGSGVEMSVSTDNNGNYAVFLACGDTYSLVVNQDTTPALLKIYQGIAGAYAGSTTKTYLKGEAILDLTIPDCKTKSPYEDVDIVVQEIELSYFEVAMINAINSVLSMITYGLREGSQWIHNALIKGNDVESSYGAIEVWKTTRNVSISLLTLALIIIAFANILSINLDQYGLTRALPKLIIAILMAFFSYFIASFLLDMMSAFQALLIEQAGGQYFQLSMESNSIINSSANAVARIPELIFLVILALGLLLAVLWLLLVLVVRNAMIFILVAVAPIAFIASALPFTEKYYKQWWGAFWKWGFIGPGIAFMLWLMSSFLGGYTASDLSERWFWLVAAAVMAFLAATLPLKMGGEIYGQITKHKDKLPGYKTGKGFIDSRKAEVDQKAKLRGQALRSKVAQSGWIGRKVAGTDETGANRMRNAILDEKVKTVEERQYDKKQAQKAYKESTGEERAVMARFLSKNGWYDDGDAVALAMMAEDFEADPYVRNNIGKEQPDALSAARAIGITTPSGNLEKAASVLRQKATSGVRDLKTAQMADMVSEAHAGNTRELVSFFSNSQKLKVAEESWDDRRMAAMGKAFEELATIDPSGALQGQAYSSLSDEARMSLDKMRSLHGSMSAAGEKTSHTVKDAAGNESPLY
jgi:hypothetical protein